MINAALKTARILVTDGIITTNELRVTPKRNRDFLVDDMRKNGYAYMHIRYTIRLFVVFPISIVHQPETDVSR